MLWYLHLAANAVIVVRRYMDDPLGIGAVLPDGSGRFVGTTLRPTTGVAPGTDLARAEAIRHAPVFHLAPIRSLRQTDRPARFR